MRYFRNKIFRDRYNLCMFAIGYNSIANNKFTYVFTYFLITPSIAIT